MFGLKISDLQRGSRRLRKQAPAFGGRRYLALLAGLLCLLVLAAVSATWLLYRSVRGEMAGQLQDHLLGIAATAAEAITGNGLERLEEPGDPAARERLRLELDRTALANGLENISLISRDGRRLLDLRGAFTGEPDPLLLVQPELASTFVSGEPRATDLVEVQGLPGEFVMTGFAALVDSTGAVRGAIAVEGGSDFFSVLPGLRRRLLFR